MTTTGDMRTAQDCVARVAIAVWVKTPGHTPAKTRLAKVIGAPAAEEFYRLAVDAVREIVEEACCLEPGLFAPYWAVAEEGGAAHACWSGFPVVAQGEGGLGERLARVYTALQATHRAVLFIGADSPQMASGILIEAATSLARYSAAPEFLVGPAEDGGFYLFGGRRPLPSAVWTGVTYSTSTTAEELIARLERVGMVAVLGATFDVDTFDDLLLVRDDLAETPGQGVARRALRDWLAAMTYPGSS